MSANKRIIKNSMMMYVMMFLTIIIGIYTSRVVLLTLGIEDFGIYSLIGGVVILFAFINGSMADAVQRFLSATLGKSDLQETTAFFNAAIVVHIGIASLVLVLGETLGLYLLKSQLVIPVARTDAAFWVYQAVLVALTFQIISTPAQAILISYEYMGTVSILTFLNPFSRFMAITAVGFLSCDKLIAFAAIIALFSFLQFILYYLFARIKCKTCLFRITTDKAKYKALTSFAGWNLFGNMVVVGKEQGTPILINMFFGVSINATIGVAHQLSSNIMSLSQKVLSAANPQIVKAYTSGDKKRAFTLVNNLSTIGFSIVLIILTPIFIETEYLLQLWLDTPPDHAVLFVRLALIVKLIDTISKPLLNLTLATGKIKFYHATVSASNLMYLPILFLVLRDGLPPEISYILSALFSLFGQSIRLIIVRNLTNFPIMQYLKNVVAKEALLVMITIITINGILTFMDNLLVNIFIAPFYVSILAFFTVLDQPRRMKVLSQLTKLRKRK